MIDPILLEISRLPLRRRLVHKQTRHHIAAVSLGVTLCYVGSFVAKCHVEIVSPVALDAFAYSIHGFGLERIFHSVPAIHRVLFATAGPLRIRNNI